MCGFRMHSNKFKFLQPVLFLVLIGINKTASLQYLAQIFANKCVAEVWFIFPGDNPVPTLPYVVISLCHIRGDKAAIIDYNETSSIKPQARFSPHSFLIDFSYVVNEEDANIFVSFYARLIIPAPQYTFFQENADKYKLFPQVDPRVFKLEFLRSRWNNDEINLYNSIGAYKLILFHEAQMPKKLQKIETGLAAKDLKNGLAITHLYYNAISGYGQKCWHYSFDDKLGALTYDFNYYDRLFCDAFEYHGLHLDTYYNRADMFHFRGKMIRDELLSSFPPDYGPNVVYYASPKLTFVVLKQKPDEWQWQFALRPFQLSLWIALLVAFATFELLKHVEDLFTSIEKARLIKKMIEKDLFAVIINVSENPPHIVALKRYANCIAIWNYCLRILSTSGYSGMILYGILQPLYPWIPTTFEELNRTKNYLVSSAKASSEFIQDNVWNNHVLNGINRNTSYLDRGDYPVPADFISKEILEERSHPDRDERKLHAIVLYDDKVNLWMKGRAFIHQTASVLSRIVVSADRVLPEIRYVSVAPGATRLHFLVETIRRVFTSGTWLRWYYLEQNYYKNVAPVLARKKLMEMGLNDTVPLDEHESRSLNIHDLFSVFAINGIGLTVAGIAFKFEILKCINL